MAASELWVPPSAAVRQGNFKKAPPPKMGDAFGAWAGQDTQYMTMPGGGVLQFDLSRLTLQDYRSMRDHYQINSSLAVLSFMMHQLDWKIECEDKKIAAAVEENMQLMWTRLIRGLSQAYWAGYSPLVIDWDNDIPNRRIVASRFKDMVPENCYVNWKKVEGYAPPGHPKPRFSQYDGIKIAGSSFPVPAESTLWYPLLMENGDYYGKKLLRTAFPSWFFSILIHLFANRYFERFGEPVPVGRAPFDDEVVLDGQPVSGRDAMELMLTQLRSRSVVVLPSDRDPNNSDGKGSYDYTIEYLESQMRGADFERYLTRLDEEMSIGLFTPILLLRTADVGSYNLGQGHMQMYMWMLNALAGDLKEYIDRYYLWRFVDFNFGPNAPRAFWKPRPLGKENTEMFAEIITSMIGAGKVKPDLTEVGDALGLSLTEVRELTTDDPNADPNADTTDPNNPDTGKPVKVAEARNTSAEIKNRIRAQVEKAFRDGTFGVSFRPALGYRRRFEESLKAEGVSANHAAKLTGDIYGRMNRWLEDICALGTDQFSDAEQFMTLFVKTLDTEVEQLAR